MCKFSVIFVIVSALLLSGMTQAASIDVTAPGDTIKGFPDDGDWPGGEAPPFVIDNDAYTKFLHFKGDNETSGFQVTASLGGMIVTGMTFTTGNDGPERDPVTFELSGSNDSIDGPYTLIAIGDVVDFNQVDAWPRNTKNATPISFDNDVAYDHYQLLFTAIRVPENGCCMQISEVELLATYEIPAGCAYRDIGTTGGYALESAGTYTVGAYGHDIWGGNDGFGYLLRPMEGNGIMKVNLASFNVTNNWAKVGVMIRETLADNSKHAIMATTGMNGCQFAYRWATGGESAAKTTSGQIPPKEMWIERDGDTLRGTFWNVVIAGVIEGWETVEETISMNTDVYIGLVVCSHDNGQRCTAVFDSVIWPAEPYNKPWLLSPEDGVTHLPLQPTLSWMPGDSATSHDVYLGTDLAALPLVDTVTEPEYTVSTPLLGNTTYYWQVVDQPGEAGPVLSFTTQYVPPWYTGTLNWERWHNMWWEEVGRMIDSIIYLEQPPDVIGEVTDAYCGPDTPVEDYGVRMSGHLIPGTSGDYTFWIAADDGCQLRLNTSDTEVCDLVKIAGFYRYSGYHDHWPAQKSATISLEAGQKYAIEILLKERGGGDWVEVAWEGPDAPSRTRITGDFLTSAYAVNAKPGIRASITPLEAGTLSWTAGKYATSQEVLFGTDPGAMASIATLPADPTVIVETTTLAMPAVASGNTYYWQVNSTDGTETWEGDVWSFTVSDWVGRDIGIEQIAENQPEPPPGSSWYDEGTDITVINAGGHELWGDHDAFHYRYTTVKMTHDTGTIQARILSVTPADSWRRGGVMIRENLGISSRKVMMHKTGHNNTRPQFRQEWRWGTGNGPDAWDLPYPMWVRIKRDHNQFDAYRSLDGENWTHAGSVTVPMEPDKFVYIGLAQCHHPGVDQSTLSTGTFDNFSYTTPDPRQAWNPSPANGATGVNIHAILSWAAGEGVAGHRVYFSDDEAAVSNRTALLAGLPADVTECDPISSGRQSLMLTETYYWVVDEVMPDGTVIPGKVVSFTVEAYRLVDDFESYGIAPEDISEQVFVPGEVLVVAVAPPAQAETQAGDTVTAEEPPAQTIIEDGYTIPGYTIEAVVPDAGCLLADWAFEGDYTDSASGFNGTPIGDATIVTDAERGNVLSLDGDGDYVDCGNPAALNFGTDNWSLSAWVKTTMTGTGDENKGGLIANGGDGGGGHRYCLILSEQEEGEVTLVTDDNVDKVQARGDTTKVNDDVWHHVLGVRDGDVIRIYIDGVEEGSAVLPSAAYDLSGASQANVLLGAISKASDGSIYKTLAGLIDDAQIYNCALTEGNARFLADVGDKVVDPIVVPPVYGPMLAHYEFEDNASDSSGNNLDGTEMAGPSGAPTYEAGNVGQAARFNGDGDHVVNTDIPLLLNGSDEMTVSLWIKSDQIDTDKGFIIFEDPAGSDKRNIRYDKKGSASKELMNVIGYGMVSTEDGQENQSAGEVQTTEWQHIVMTWKSGVGAKLYLDGLLDTPGYLRAARGGVIDGMTKLIIGKGGKDSGDKSWDGLVDDVRIYNTALSYGQIRYLAGEMADLDIPPVYGPLIAEYTFDADASDSSGNNLHGTLIGDASVTGGELVLDGDGDCVDLGHHAAFNPQAGPFSISAWVKLEDWKDCWGNVIISKRGENGRGWQLRRRGCDERLVFTTRGCGNDDPGGNINPGLGEWRHVAAVRDGDKKTLYIDGVIDNVAGINNNPIEWSGHNAYIGGRATKDNRGIESYFKGNIDKLQLYSHALTEGEVRYLAGVGDLKLRDLYVPLLLHMEFEGNLDDSTSNENHGTPYGAIGFETDPIMGEVLSLPGGSNQYVSIPPVGISGKMPTTIACWAKADHTNIPDWSLIFGFTGNVGGGGGGGTHFNIGSLGGPGGVGAHVWGWEATIFSDDEALDWRHYAMTYDGGTVRYYGDGVLIGERDYDLSPRADRVHVGSRVTQDSSFPGKVDDARIYDIALTRGQILGLSGYELPNPMSDTWSGRGAASPKLDYDIANGGSQSMRVEYTGDGAVKRLEPFRDGADPHEPSGDWTLGGTEALSLWFRGDTGNANGLMFAQLTTTVPSAHTQRVMYDGDPVNLTIPNWHEWNIELHELYTGKPAEPIPEEGLPATKIKEIGIGVLGGSGVLHFDDIRVYPTRCVPALGPASDINGDCVVDDADLGRLLGSWLALSDPGISGVWYEYYEDYFDGLDDFDVRALTPKKSGIAANFDIGLRDRDDGFGFRFTAMVDAPVDGFYTFHTSSDDGSELYVDGVMVVDNDGFHGMQWRSGTRYLKAGLHPIMVTMFEWGGGEGLLVEVEGPGIPRMSIPNEVLYLPIVAADLNDDGIVNFKDYAILLQDFLLESLYP